MKRIEKILLIDDDLDIQDLVAGFFRNLNYEVSTYSDAQSALEDISQNKIQCDVVVTDLMLPGITGIEFTHRMKAIGSSIPIILITANKKVEVAVSAIAAGAYDFVLKPIHFPQLLVSVERALYLAKLREENLTLKTIVNLQDNLSNLEGVIGKSQGIRNVFDLAKRVAKSSANILITGESGTGKEVIAKAIHDLGNRKKMPFIVINCSAIPENLLESELFGHTKGAFTGAFDKRIGLFEEAEGGTLFLDEIGDMSLPLQAKLLRVLQERKIKRIGENQFRSINVRILAATHKNLRQEIIEKKFAALDSSQTKQLSKEALDYLVNNYWRGNVRELENTIERAVVLARSNTIQIEDVTSINQVAEVIKDKNNFQFPVNLDSKVLTVDELVNKYVLHILNLNNGVKEKTAADLQIDRKTLYRRLREVGNTI